MVSKRTIERARFFWWRVLGGHWASLGRHLAGFWAILGGSWSFVGAFWAPVEHLVCALGFILNAKCARVSAAQRCLRGTWNWSQVGQKWHLNTEKILYSDSGWWLFFCIGRITVYRQIGRGIRVYTDRPVGLQTPVPYNNFLRIFTFWCTC